MSEPSHIGICFDDFRVLARVRGLPDDKVELERLHDGYVKLQAMMASLRRPSSLETGLPLVFQPIQVR